MISVFAYLEKKEELLINGCSSGSKTGKETIMQNQSFMKSISQYKILGGLTCFQLKIYIYFIHNYRIHIFKILKYLSSVQVCFA